MRAVISFSSHSQWTLLVSGCAVTLLLLSSPLYAFLHIICMHLKTHYSPSLCLVACLFSPTLSRFEPYLKECFLSPQDLKFNLILKYPLLAWLLSTINFITAHTFDSWVCLPTFVSSKSFFFGEIYKTDTSTHVHTTIHISTISTFNKAHNILNIAFWLLIKVMARTRTVCIIRFVGQSKKLKNQEAVRAQHFLQWEVILLGKNKEEKVEIKPATLI